MQNKITQRELKKILRYNPKKGELFWKIANSRCIKIGQEAGCVSTNDGYCYIGINGEIYKRSRLIWIYVHGNIPEGDVDHINHNRSDDRLSNLRVVTHQDNCKNQRRRITNTSGVMGVCRHNNKWLVYIEISGNRKYLGHHTVFAEAVKVRKAAEKKYGYHKNHGSAIAKTS